MTVLASAADISKIRESGKVVREILSYAKELVKEGVSTAFLDRQIEYRIFENGSEPAFKGYKGYPAAICASVNEVVVHGIPSEEILLKEGDIVSIDVGIKKDGFYADAAATFAVGKIDKEAERLMKVTEKGPRLKEGMVLAIEPMVNAGTREIKILKDGWTAVTGDGKLSAHFEHTVIVGKEEAEILT